MECERLTNYLAPGKVVGRFGKVGTLIAIRLHFLACIDLEVREEAANKSVGNSIEYLPAVLGLIYLRSEHFIERRSTSK